MSEQMDFSDKLHAEIDLHNELDMALLQAVSVVAQPYIDLVAFVFERLAPLVRQYGAVAERLAQALQEEPDEDVIA